MTGVQTCALPISFGGWYSQEDLSGERVDTEGVYTPNGDITLYAKWIAHTYTVVYNGNLATSGETENSNHTYDEEKALTTNGFKREYKIIYNHNYAENSSMPNPADEERTVAYTFNGWAESEEGAKVYNDRQAVKNLTAENSGNINLYANWSSNSDTYEPEREGYTFAGWYTNEECTGDRVDEEGEYTPRENITLYAKWTANRYTVIYEGNGATDGETESTIHTYDAEKRLAENGYIRKYTVTYNHNYVVENTTENSENEEVPVEKTPEKVTRTAVYNFDGWSKEANGEVVYEEEANVVNLASNEGDEVRIYAKWSETSVEYVPVRTGYTFGGWYADEECTRQVITASNPTYTPSRDIELYAKWIENSYTVIYNGNNATSGETEDSTHTYDMPKRLNGNGYKRE